MADLSARKCAPCHGDTPALSEVDAAAHLRDLNGNWHLQEGLLTRDYTFKNFMQAMAFVNRVAEVAETQGHHPDILLHGYKHVRINIYTHAIGGLSINDFILAAHVDRL